MSSIQNSNLKKASHAAYDIRYNFVWTTKYRKPIFVGQNAVVIRNIIRRVCAEFKIEILQGVVKKDCIKLVISAPPTISVSVLAGKIKGKSAMILFKENEEFRKIYPGGHLWAAGYFVSTNVNMSTECVLKYIEVDESYQEI